MFPQNDNVPPTSQPEPTPPASPPTQQQPTQQPAPQSPAQSPVPPKAPKPAFKIPKVALIIGGAVALVIVAVVRFMTVFKTSDSGKSSDEASETADVESGKKADDEAGEANEAVVWKTSDFKIEFIDSETIVFSPDTMSGRPPILFMIKLTNTSSHAFRPTDVLRHYAWQGTDKNGVTAEETILDGDVKDQYDALYTGWRKELAPGQTVELPCAHRLMQPDTVSKYGTKLYVQIRMSNDDLVSDHTYEFKY